MRLIELEAALKVLTKEAVFCVENFKDGEARGLVTAKESISKLPTIEAEPVRHGRWERNTCSVCGNVNPTTFMDMYGDYISVKTPYCPKCGAKMDKEG